MFRSFYKHPSSKPTTNAAQFRIKIPAEKILNVTARIRWCEE